MATSNIPHPIKEADLTYVIGRRIQCLESNTSVTIEGGGDFKHYRAPVLCVYTDQNNNLSWWVIRMSDLSCQTLGGATNLTATFSGNDIIVSGVGNWGQGFAIGQRR